MRSTFEGYKKKIPPIGSDTITDKTDEFKKLVARSLNLLKGFFQDKQVKKNNDIEISDDLNFVYKNPFVSGITSQTNKRYEGEQQIGTSFYHVINHQIVALSESVLSFASRSSERNEIRIALILRSEIAKLYFQDPNNTQENYNIEQEIKENTPKIRKYFAEEILKIKIEELPLKLEAQIAEVTRDYCELIEKSQFTERKAIFYLPKKGEFFNPEYHELMGLSDCEEISFAIAPGYSLQDRNTDEETVIFKALVYGE